MSASHRVLVLRKEFSGESFLKLHLLGPELGCQLCLKRLATRKPSLKAAPDLFDSAEVQLEGSRPATAQFVGDYQIIRRRDAIGLNYRALQYASHLSQLLVDNGGQMADLPALHQLAERSLDAFAARREPPVVFLKSIYLLLKDEGYPVRELWWPQLPDRLREVTRQLLAQPSPASLQAEDKSICEAAVNNLLHWLRRETDLSLADGIL